MLLNPQIKDYRIILASQSPRRKMLLEGLDLEFEVYVRPGIEEVYPKELGMLEIPEHLAFEKSQHYLDLLQSKTILITADTIVWLNNKLVGKPKDLVDAQHIIAKLAGNTHEVITGVCIRSQKTTKIFHSHSTVHFSSLSEDEIDFYIQKYKPLDKAGAYGIQEWIGYVGIEKIEGSFYNVMGLPVQRLYRELLDFV